MHLVEREELRKRHFKLFYRHDRRCFAPTLGVLAGSGLIKGVLALCTSLNLLTTESGTYIILNAAADAFFYFLPIFWHILLQKVQYRSFHRYGYCSSSRLSYDCQCI